ncbi:hepatitis A virus cellular receptor 1-like [Cyprinodon tularosa]|uniref:hepatitis A virus cellular receptor 1-like n=1 Tax=Cyprinodon tularosa TaxID=77115 RepID=UPI0018E28578|nr:hepatitis A virus cellular receptor 1-like [Cyprinodon tularosa]
MMLLLLHSLASVCIRSVSAVATETVLGVAGQVVELPCRLEEARQRGVEVCWGRGKPSLFTCHNTIINFAGEQVKFQQSHRFSVSSSTSALSISKAQLSDTGFYHCRVQLPGLFNDQTSIVHLMIINPHSVTSKHLGPYEVKKFNTSHAVTSFITEEGGSDVAGIVGTEPMVAKVKATIQEEPEYPLQTFVGSTLRLAFIIFIPLVLLAAAYRVWRANQREEKERRSGHLEEESSSV